MRIMLRKLAMSKVYLAMYKAEGNWVDKIIRLFTGKPYSHCELAVANGEKYLCYSSSPRDGGVRYKLMHLGEDKWDLIPLDNVTEEKIKAYFNRTCGKAYDWWGAIGIVLCVKQKRSKYFCSEWCFNAIYNSEEGWRFSPNKLAQILLKGE